MRYTNQRRANFGKIVKMNKVRLDLVKEPAEISLGIRIYAIF